MTTTPPDPWSEVRAAFSDSAQWFAATVQLADGRWDQPGLGVWDVRALVGHTTRALLTLETYLSRPVATRDVRSTAEYYLVTAAAASDDEVAQRGRDAGAALGPDPVSTVAAIVDRVPALLDRAEADLVVATIAGGIRLGHYVPTRTFELVVHTLDLARALGAAAEPPPAAASAALRVVADLAPRRGLAGPVLAAVTGREMLGPGFSIL
ncbi:maleylpyruvate isomerase N-terminal domain-containing protein [Cellulomonas rhizosphaerae]|uniref:Mycothiol-dependent maleylpyruvate isomerase metal-binding domain-containing protein n=1 Tax=Cellulomonas rhizosphaerae TaxID=2293719 RepID=A0A413RNN1_9CELL|nr:maleylpyruvate isomerase N-terminal domain-containing protein [Cellulomonas rhizosphaerae]RHA43626.1 hypothetical protein D1825_05430 [Cellulomonas rhizosphaerae]